MQEADAGGTIRVLLADDEQPFLDALSPLIERQPQLAVVGTALDGLAAIELADELGPDAVVIGRVRRRPGRPARSRASSALAPGQAPL